MTTALTFVLGFFVGAMAVGFICFCGLTVYFYNINNEARKEIYANDEENTNEADTS